MDVFCMEDLKPPDRKKLSENGRNKKELIAMCITAVLILVLFSISIHQTIMISGFQIQLKAMAFSKTEEINEKIKIALNNVSTDVTHLVGRLENKIKTALNNVSTEVSNQVGSLAKFTPYQIYQPPSSEKGVFTVKANHSILLKEDMITNSSWHFTHMGKQDTNSLLLIPPGCVPNDITKINCTNYIASEDNILLYVGRRIIAST